MQLHIKADQTIWELQNSFSAKFPFLKLEFLKPGHRRKKVQPPRLLHPGNSLKTAYDGEPKEGILEYSDQTTVAELEKLFKEKFNLEMQVFRRSGMHWLETTTTDAWTLEAQNIHGRESTEFQQPDEVPDYHLNRDNDE